MPFSSRYSHLSPPLPGSSSNSPCRLSLVVWEMCTLLGRKHKPLYKKIKCVKEFDCSPWNNALLSYPGIPPDSILLATVTSVDQTSNCHLFWPSTPPSTVPVWTPTRMSTSVLVFSRTYLDRPGKQKITFLQLNRLLCLIGFFYMHNIQFQVFSVVHANTTSTLSPATPLFLSLCSSLGV